MVYILSSTKLFTPPHPPPWHLRPSSCVSESHFARPQWHPQSSGSFCASSESDQRDLSTYECARRRLCFGDEYRWEAANGLSIVCAFLSSQAEVSLAFSRHFKPGSHSSNRKIRTKDVGHGRNRRSGAVLIPVCQNSISHSP